MQRHFFIIWNGYSLFCLLIFLPVILFAAKPTDLIGLRINSASDSSRFTFILSQKTTGKVKYIPDKNQLWVDFTNTRMAFKMQNAKLENANVNSITTVNLGNGDVRFILSVTGKIKWNIQFKAIKTAGAELVLDIYSVKSTMHFNVKQKLQQALRQKFAESALKTFATLHKETMSKASPSRLEPKPTTAKKHRLFTIVIDAGHGGKDSGAMGLSGAAEKDVVLAIAKRLANEINKQPNMHALLTRTGDYFVPLRARLKLARKDNADLFVAIHADAYFDNNANGVSVYALSKRGATTEAARWLAQRENYAELDEVELNALQDRSPQLRSVLIDLAQTTTIRDSLRLGNKILDALDDISLLRYKHVQQAPFVVLKSPDIPSILVETGFISNPREEKRLTDVRYQEKLAKALCQGITLYVKTYAVLEWPM